MSSKPVCGALAAVARCLVVCPLLIAGGCASQSEYRQANYYAGAPRPAAAPARPAAEMEDDGRPGQIPPRPEQRRVADDPTQPWSPNYGGPAAKPVRAQEPQPAVLPAGPRRVALAVDPR